MPSLCRLIPAAAACALTVAGLATPAVASPSGILSADESRLAGSLAGAMRSAGPASGAYVVNVTDGRVVFRWNHARPRILASNTKLFTTGAALARFGTEGKLATEVRGRGELDDDGVFRGDLYLVGGGDPTFGSRAFGERAYGGGASVEELAGALADTGIERVTGRVIGDESNFDSLRGGPESGFNTSIYVGPLSATSFNRGLANEAGSAFQGNPPLFAAARLDAALEARGVRVRLAPRAGAAPQPARTLAATESPGLSRLAALTNKPSDNYFAEMLLKGLALQASGKGTTSRGASIAAGFARRLGVTVRLADGSGLSRGNRASPRAVVRYLLALRERTGFRAFSRSLAVAGRDGTLTPRMRSGPARGRCRGKTGTLSNVSALSGFCEARSGETYAFSFLMNGIDPFGARALQDRMAQAIAAVD